MRKFIVGIIISLSCFLSGVIFADNIPDDVNIQVKNPLIQGEAANLTITMMKNGQTMTSYTGMIWIEITDEKGNPLKESEYTLPSIGGYEFLPEDLGSKEFQRGLEIKKEGKFYIKVSDFIDEVEYGQTSVTVTNDNSKNRDHSFNILSPIQNSTIINDKLEIIANIAGRSNSNVSVYIDNKLVDTILTESNGSLSYTTTSISTGRHVLKLTALDFLGNALGTSDEVYFTYDPQKLNLYKSIKINPETGLMIGDIIDITIYTDEMAESVKMKLSDRSENDSIPLSKLGNGEFFTNTFLISSGNIDISVEISATNNSTIQKYDNIQTINVSESPEIANVTVETDEESQKATISRETSNNIATSFLITYRVGDGDDVTHYDPTRTDKKSFVFTDVPYNTNVYLDITPYRNKTEKHGSASKTITFKLVKPEQKCGNGIIDEGESCDTCPQDLGNICAEPKENTCGNGEFDEGETCSNCPEDLGSICPQPKENTCGNGKYDEGETCNNCPEDLGNVCTTPKQNTCSVQNISTHTKKIGDSYYLIWDKVENVSKYIVYSSTLPDGSDKVKIYETKDTSYEYPFDHTSEEDKFMYFWITGICDDGEELQLTGATKVQVGPAENFFLLLCLTFLIYFGIKLFRQTE